MINLSPIDDIEIKTVWHWKNIGKMFATFFALLPIPVLVTLVLELPISLGMIVGGLWGYVLMLLLMCEWDAYHFETYRKLAKRKYFLGRVKNVKHIISDN